MALTYPVGHKPRHENFELKGFLDETLREGAERCLFTVDDTEKFNLTNKLVEAGIRDIIIGSGPQDPQLLYKYFNTIKKTLEGAKFPKDLIENDKFIHKVLNVVEEKMNTIYESKREDFTEINEKIIEFYFTDVMSAVDIIEISNNLSITGSIS